MWKQAQNAKKCPFGHFSLICYWYVCCLTTGCALPDLVAAARSVVIVFIGTCAGAPFDMTGMRLAVVGHMTVWMAMYSMLPGAGGMCLTVGNDVLVSNISRLYNQNC